MSWFSRSRYHAVLAAARAELGESLADDPLAMHLALQIEAAELALEHRVDWLIEKRDEELAKRREESETTLEDTSFTSPSANVIEARPLTSRAPVRESLGPRIKGRIVCSWCGAEQGTPHSPVCPAMAAMIPK